MKSEKLLKLLKDHNNRIVESLGYSQDYSAVDIFYEIEGTIIKAAEDGKDASSRIYPLLRKLYCLNGDPNISLDLNNGRFRSLVEKYTASQTKHYKKMLEKEGSTYKEILEKTYGNSAKKHINERYDLLIGLVGGIAGLIKVSGGIFKETKTKMKIKLIKTVAIKILKKAKEAELC